MVKQEGTPTLNSNDELYENQVSDSQTNIKLQKAYVFQYAI